METFDPCFSISSHELHLREHGAELQDRQVEQMDVTCPEMRTEALGIGVEYSLVVVVVVVV